MANIKSAAKRARRSLKQREVNRHNKSLLKGAIKAARTAKGENKPEEIKKVLSRTFSALDKSVYKGVLHKNAAARHKKRLSKLLQPQTKATA